MIADSRMFALASPFLIPMIDKRKREALGRLMQAHKSGKSDTATIVAEISAYTDLEMEIKQKELMYRTLEENNGNTRG